MLITNRRATVWLHFELFYFKHLTKIKSLSGYLSKFLLAYLDKSTLTRDHSLLVKVGTGWEQFLAFDRGNASQQEKQVNCEVEISMGKVDRWLMFKTLSGPLPCKLQAVSFCNSAIITKLTTLSIKKKRSENSLDMTKQQTNAQQQNAIPVNHNKVKRNLYGKSTAQTSNTSYYLWSGGPVVLKKGRGLNIGCSNHIWSYSTKISSETLSWNDTKVAKRLKLLWEGNKLNPKVINKGLWKLLQETSL